MSARDEIEETLYQYAEGFDDDDLDLLASCFTEDAEVSSGAGENRGRPAIHDAYQARRDAREAGERVRHVVTNVRVDCSTAIARGCARTTRWSPPAHRAPVCARAAPTRTTSCAAAASG